MNYFEKIRGLLTETPRHIPAKGFIQPHRDDPRSRSDPEMRRSFTARSGHSYIDMLNWRLGRAKAAGNEAAVKMYTDALSRRQRENPGSTGEAKAENASTELNMCGYERIYEFLTEDKVLKATSSQVRPMRKYTSDLTDEEMGKFNRAMSTKTGTDEWRSPSESRRIALRGRKK